MANLFESISDKLKNSSIVIWIYLAAFAMLVIGINHFVEDTLSSYYGIQQIEKSLKLIPASYDFTYWTMSLAPQVGQVIFSYIYLTNTKNRWAGLMSIGCFFVDFGSDVWYRSSQNLFSSSTVFIASFIITIIFFTIGSELFITIGIGLVLELTPLFILMVKKELNRIIDALLNIEHRIEQRSNVQPTFTPPSFTQDPDEDESTRSKVIAYKRSHPSAGPSEIASALHISKGLAHKYINGG